MHIIKQMFFIFSFFMLSVSAIYCVALFAAPSDPVSAQATEVNGLPSESEKNKEQGGNINSAKPQNSNSSEEAAETKSNSEAKGKIVNKSVNFADGNLKYNNVSVKNITPLAIDLKSELAQNPSLRLEQTEKPQVLIMHTHTTESFMTEKRDYYTSADLSRTTDDRNNITVVGAVLKAGLEANGIGVVHATEKHDYPEYTGSYGRSAETVKKYLEKYPTVKVVIDLHRDAIMDSNGTKTALVKKINGQEAAQLMLVAGCEAGTVTGYPDWKENFHLALKIQQGLEVMYPGLARPMLLTEKKYNQNLTKGSILIECGTDANTLEQAKYSAALLAESLSATLNMLKQ